MALFNNWGKKASEATAKTVQKAQDLSEISKLNSMISDEEKRIDNNYYQIGKLYVSMHREDAEASLLPMMDAICVSEQKINEFNLKIQDIKGIRKCIKCGAEVSKEAAFCSACGAQLPRNEPVVPEGSIKCSKCGTIMQNGMRFCISCGAPIQQPLKISIPRQLSESSGQLKTNMSSVIPAQTAEIPELHNTDGEALAENIIDQEVGAQKAFPDNETEVHPSELSANAATNSSASFNWKSDSESSHESTTTDGSIPVKASTQSSEIKVCPNCGEKIPKGFSFCGVCGAAIQEDDTLTTNITLHCPNCGASVEDGMLFCTECGCRISQASSADEIKPKSAVCPNCGAEITDDMLFCVECGYKL